MMPPASLESLDDLTAAIERMRAARPRASGPLIVGLAGAPGAGKSTVAAALSAGLPGSAVLPMDGFHLPQAELVRLGRRDRMGAPDTFDVDAFVALLESLRDLHNSGETLRAPGFDRRVEEPVPGAIALAPEWWCVIVEGNYLLLREHGWHRVAPLLDLSVGIVLDDAIRHERLIARHIAFGKNPDAARAWALGPDERNAAAIAATLERADYLLDTSANESSAGSSTR
ncbi:nucleoside/nucleotide kinase family protein [Microcella sp.]|uniref:nucleoside/nucleotide kinase family protein n=1 Tax=Microcella sp. TaxID=1913979 RepID=UPI0025D173E9|nr:nucleoside/nucleotide kinase family protein [Microcella sp.]